MKYKRNWINISKKLFVKIKSGKHKLYKNWKSVTYFFKPPAWCQYDCDPLGGMMGCWSLIGEAGYETIKAMRKNKCNTCDMSKKYKGNP
jgi:hypothetical protein